MKWIQGVSIIILIFLNVGCSTEQDIESGIVGTWKCTKVTSEIVKPNWIRSDLGSGYERIIRDHAEATEATIFTFEANNSYDYQNVSLNGGRGLYSTWSVIQETKTIDFSFTTKGTDVMLYDYETKQEVKKKLKSVQTGYGFDEGLYAELEEMSWLVKEFDSQNKMLVTETLGRGSVIFTYYLEFVDN